MTTKAERVESLRSGEEPRLLSIAELLEAPDVETRTLFIPEWGGSIEVRGLTKEDQYELRKAATVGGEVDETVAELGAFVRAVTFEGGAKLTMEHVGELKRKGAGPVDRVLEVIRELSGLGQGAQDAKKATFPPGAGD